MKIFGYNILSKANDKRVTELDGVRLTPAQQLAYMQAENAADQMMNAIRWAKALAWLILLIVMTVSYEDQHSYLERIGLHEIGAKLIPFAFDAATVLCVMVIGVFAMKRIAKMIALFVVLFPVGASAFINVKASPTVAVAIVYVLVVCLIPAIELIKAFMGADFDRMLGAEANLLGAAKTHVVASTAKSAKHVERGQKAAITRAARKAERAEAARLEAQAAAEAAAEAARLEEERKEAARRRGIAAAETRARRAEEARIQEEAAKLEKERQERLQARRDKAAAAKAKATVDA